MATPNIITWKGTTDTSLGVVVRSVSFSQPDIRVEMTEVEGRDGVEVTELGRRPYSLLVDIELLPSANIDNVIAWLNGSGVLIRYDDPLKYLNARIISQINYSKVQSTKQATVEFFVYNPYRYLLSEANQTITSFPATISNGGTAESLPLLKITGSGTVNLTLNGITFEYIFPSGETYVYIDCDEQEAYLGAEERNRALTITGDNYMKLSVGNNTLALNSGTVSEVIVTKRTRYL